MEGRRASTPPDGRGLITLDQFFEEWRRGHGVHLARSTRASYDATWTRYIGPALGQHTLQELSERPELVQQFHAELAQATGQPSVRRTLVILPGVLQRAIEWNRIRYNPVAAIRKPSGRRFGAVHPLTPDQVERTLGLLVERSRLRDAALICTLAYAGLRPGEALALGWRHVRSRTLLIEAAVSDGELKATKTGAVRAVQLLPPLAADLAAWRDEQSRTASSALVFPNSHGSYWTASDWRNWRARAFVPAMRDAGVSCRRPYDLRHSFCSLLIHEGRSVAEVAQQMGHSPNITLSTYAHVFAELAEAPERLSAVQLVQRARTERLQEMSELGPLSTRR